MLINMVKAVATRSGMRKTPTVKETEKQPPLKTNLNKDNTPRTEDSKDMTSNSCKDTPKDTSIKEMQSTDPFCKCIMKRLLNKTAPKHELNTFFIHNGRIQICIRSLKGLLRPSDSQSLEIHNPSRNL